MRSLLRSIQMLAIGLWAVSLVGATTACGGGGSDGGGCCKMCSTGKACGDSCIAREYTCHEGNGCACNSKLVASAPAAVPVVESFVYAGPAGLRYEAEPLAGKLATSLTSVEIEAGRTTGLYWEGIYLGELVPSPGHAVVRFDTDLKGTPCVALSHALVLALQNLKPSSSSVASLQDLAAMGFPHIDELRAMKDIRQLAASPRLLSVFGVGLESVAGCE